MIRLRSRLAVVARVALLTIVGTQVGLSAEAGHARCAAAKHDCGSTARIASCCCVGDTDAARTVGPIVPAIRMAPSGAATPALVPRELALVVEPRVQVECAPAPALREDLPILLGNLRV